MSRPTHFQQAPMSTIFTNNVAAILDSMIESGSYCSVMVLVDSNTRQLVLPKLESHHLANAHIIEIPAGDEHKSLDTLTQVWHEMEASGATRHSLLVNLGGGMVTDLGGLAAATFKRGIDFVNVPTTLLSAVDAAIGCKTGINFEGLKNEIGVFAPATQVIISTCFFSTLPQQQFKAGFAEMLKHAMLSSHSEFASLLDYDFGEICPDALLEKLQASVKVKQDIVEQDPTENGLRKALNLGHTVGHAFESKALQDGKPVPHGYAVAWGLVTEIVLSHMLKGFPSEDLYALASFVKTHYGAFHITCDNYDQLLTLMRHDKKSRTGEINCTLLKACGEPTIDNSVNDEDLKIALDIYRDLMDI